MRRGSAVVLALLLLACSFALCARPVVAQSKLEVVTNSLDMKLVLIPAGEFMMGPEEDRSETLRYFKYCDPKWLNGELPRHKVRITKSFYLGQHEVTLGQFLTFYRDAKYQAEFERYGKANWGYDKEGRNLVESTLYRPWNPIAWEIGEDHPAIYVSWKDATAFCTWLSRKEGKKYRLPTEAEWEYACRAGTSNRYHCGSDPEELCRFGNVADNDRKAVTGEAIITAFDGDGKKTSTGIPFPFVTNRDGYAWTAPVGKFRPNAFGLYDMHGNVWEWCSDWYDEKYYATSPVEDPQGPAAGSFRVVRGGGFNTPPVSLRCAYRDLDDPERRFNRTGFRVVCER